MTEKLTPEDVRELTGEDIEDLQDEQHPEGRLDEDAEGTGVDEPDLDSAKWDNEIEEEDRGDIHLKDMDFEKLTSEDRSFYLRMASLREELRNLGASKDILNKIKQLANEIAQVQRGLISDKKERGKFLAMINNKLTNISLETQVDLIKK